VLRGGHRLERVISRSTSPPDGSVRAYLDDCRRRRICRDLVVGTDSGTSRLRYRVDGKLALSWGRGRWPHGCLPGWRLGVWRGRGVIRAEMRPGHALGRGLISPFWYSAEETWKESKDGRLPRITRQLKKGPLKNFKILLFSPRSGNDNPKMCDGGNRGKSAKYQGTNDKSSAPVSSFTLEYLEALLCKFRNSSKGGTALWLVRVWVRHNPTVMAVLPLPFWDKHRRRVHQTLCVAGPLSIQGVRASTAGPFESKPWRH